MKTTIIDVPAVKIPIRECPKLLKKDLADSKFDLLALCDYGFRAAVEKALGRHPDPGEDCQPAVYPEILDNLKGQLSHNPPTWGMGKTLLVSFGTEAFSPMLVKSGTTRAALELLLERTSFRIRVLTKNSIVGSEDWIQFFNAYPQRFSVGLTIGSDEDTRATRHWPSEFLTTAKLEALHRLQDAGIPTYGMLLPVSQKLLGRRRLEGLLDRHRQEHLEHVWVVTVWRGRAGEASNRWLGRVGGVWKRSARKAEREGWVDKLTYLIVETGIAATTESFPQSGTRLKNERTHYFSSTALGRPALAWCLEAEADARSHRGSSDSAR